MEDREAWLADTMIDLADSMDVREAAYLETLTRHLSELVAPAEVGLLVTTDTGSLARKTTNTHGAQDGRELSSPFSGIAAFSSFFFVARHL